MSPKSVRIGCYSNRSNHFSFAPRAFFSFRFSISYRSIWLADEDDSNITSSKIPLTTDLKSRVYFVWPESLGFITCLEVIGFFLLELSSIGKESTVVPLLSGHLLSGLLSNQGPIDSSSILSTSIKRPKSISQRMAAFRYFFAWVFQTGAVSNWHWLFKDIVP